MIPLLLLAALVQRPDTVAARVVAIIGEDSPGRPIVFSRVSGFAFDPAGRLYVSDLQDPRLVVFDPMGKEVGQVGRSGAGPGEFRAPTGPVIGPDGALYVRNGSFLARFTADAKTGWLSRFDRNLDGPALAPWTSLRATYFDRTGRYYFPMEWMDGNTKQAIRSFARYSAEGHLLDTLPIPTYPTEPSLTASVMTSPNSGRMIAGLNAAPFEPRSAWTVTPEGTILSGDGATPTLQETDRAGRVLRTFTVSGAGRKIPARERAESLTALRGRIDSLRGPLSEVRGTSLMVREQRLPENYPTYTGLLMAGGELWVRRWASTGHTLFDRFRHDGHPNGTVTFPVECAPEPVPVVSGARAVCLVVDRETGGEAVALLALPR